MKKTIIENVIKKVLNEMLTPADIRIKNFSNDMKKAFESPYASETRPQGLSQNMKGNFPGKTNNLQEFRDAEGNIWYFDGKRWINQQQALAAMSDDDEPEQDQNFHL